LRYEIQDMSRGGVQPVTCVFRAGLVDFMNLSFDSWWWSPVCPAGKVLYSYTKTLLGARSRTTFTDRSGIIAEETLLQGLIRVCVARSNKKA